MTIRQILETIPDKKIRKEAIENSKNPECNGVYSECNGVYSEDEDEEFITKSYSKISKALHAAFYWEYSSQGHDYWKNIEVKFSKQGL